MKQTFAQLLKTQELPACICLSGEAPYLKEKARQHLRGLTKTHWLLFEEDETKTWQSFSTEQMGLFAKTQTHIDLRLSTLKWSELAKETLQAYLNTLSSDTCLILSLPKLSPSFEKSAFFKAFLKKGIWVPLYPPRPHETPALIRAEFDAEGLTLSKKQLETLTQAYEGDLLGLANFSKLLSLTEKESISDTVFFEHLQTQARFQAFSLPDALFSGNLDRALLICKRLEDEGIELPMLIGALTHAFQTLTQVFQLSQQGMPFEQAARESKLWRTQQGLYQALLPRLSLKLCAEVFQTLSDIDQQLKGMKKGAPWRSLQHFCHTFIQRTAHV